jgi:DNA primase
VGQTYIAVGPDNMDPCELRLAKGDAAVRDLVARREPLVAFALRSQLSRFNLDTAEGRVGALRVTAPLVAKIKDRALRPEYTRKLAGDLGMEVETVLRAVTASAGRAEPELVRPTPLSTVDSPQWIVEREALKLAIQAPALAGPMFDSIGAEAYQHTLHVTVRTAVAEAGGATGAVAGAGWVEQIRDECLDLTGKALVSELAVEPLRLDGEPDPRYVAITLSRVQLSGVTQQIQELKSKLQRLNPVTNVDEHLRLFGELVSLEQHARALKEQAVGGL